MLSTRMSLFTFFYYIIFSIVILMVLPPVLLLILYSFLDIRIGQPLSILIPFKNHYINLFTDPINTNAIINSLIVATFSSLIATTIAVILSWICAKTNAPLVRKMEPFVLLPISLSPFLYALTWISLLDPYIGIISSLIKVKLFNIYSLEGLIFVTSLAATPLAYIVIKPFFEQLDASLEEASIISGANKLLTFRRITLGLATPTIFSAYLLSFVWCMEELGIPLMLAAPAGIPIASLRIYQLTLSWPPNHNLAAALAVVIMVINVLIYNVAQKIILRKRWTTVGLRGFRRDVLKLGRLKYVLTTVYLIVISIASIAPLVSIMIQSFSSTYKVPSTMSELTLENINKVFSSPIAITSIGNSLTITPIGSLLLVFFVFMLGYIITRSEYRFRKILDILAMFPLSIPSIVVALGIFIYFAYVLPTMIYTSVWAIMIGLCIRFVGHGLRAIVPSLQQIHPGLEDAARMSGASQLKVIKDILLKIMVPALISTYTFLFIYFIRELPLSILLSTSKSMVWTAGIYSLWELGNVKIVFSFALLEIFLILSVRYLGNYLTIRFRRW
ncbi:MAG: iron ABC transporter permease [Saccharolobus sp.]|uniref:ABC transporter permease n=1 Tax=Saccharolobus sp. TaxID=2100761 RepID=UPI00316CC298